MTPVSQTLYKRVLKLADQDCDPADIAAQTGLPVAEVRRIVYAEAPLSLDPDVELLLVAGEASPYQPTRTLAARARTSLEALMTRMSRERQAVVLKQHEDELLRELQSTREQRRALPTVKKGMS